MDVIGSYSRFSLVYFLMTDRYWGGQDFVSLVALKLQAVGRLISVATMPYRRHVEELWFWLSEAKAGAHPITNMFLELRS